jgi:exopolyphosphatase/guanosine-5'-triphosphate,3'-diphosphate pyrophosphatase
LKTTAIDIGTNTVLMLIADFLKDGRIRTLRDEIAFPRLGRGVDKSGLISRESLGQVLSVLTDYKELSHSLGSKRIIACGTSALRDAQNSDEVIRTIREELAINVEVLSGDEEARWTFLGALANEDESPLHSGRDQSRFAVIDIGGGSTEVTTGTASRADKRHSIDVGCIRLTERYLEASPPTPNELQRAAASVQRALAGLDDIDPTTCRLVGVAGTLTTLAALDLNLSSFETRRVDGHVLALESIKRIFDQIRTQTLRQLHSSPLISPGRADILLAGILILIEFMTSRGFSEVKVSARGLRYGLVLRELERMRRIEKRD